LVKVKEEEKAQLDKSSKTPTGVQRANLPRTPKRR